MNPKIMRTVHAFVHHEDTGFNNRAFTGFEYHRTDGKLRRSASLQYFNVWFFFEAQYAVACVGDFNSKGFFHVKFHIAFGQRSTQAFHRRHRLD
jgi:hypothetical protein